MIDKGTIDKIFDSAIITEVVGDFVNLKKRGVNYLGNCPFHNEKTPSFTVSPAKGIYKCFGCGVGGNSVNFIMEHEQLSYVETLKYLAKKYHIEVVEKEMTPEEKEKKDSRESLMIVSDFAGKTFTHNLHNSDEGRAIGLKYFKERAFNEKTIEQFQLGYCRKERDSFTKLAQQKGYQVKYLADTGLTIQRDDGSTFDRFSERVMFPIHNLMGRVIGFGGRTLRSDKKIAKYLNSPASEIYDKSKVLYGLYFAKKAIVKNDKCFMVEGYTDVMRMHQSGIENVVASSGTSLTVEQIRLIKRFTPNMTVLYDGDAAGIKAALRGIDLVLQEGMNVKVVLLPDGEDPDSLAQKKSASEMADYISENETDFIKFKTNLLLAETQGDPVKKANLIKDIVKTISVIPDGITRSMYAKECSNLLDVEERLLHTEISKNKDTDREKQWKKEQNQQNHPDEPPADFFAPQGPSGPAQAPIFDTGKKFDMYEKEIIRILLSYGNKHLFTIAANDKEPEQKIYAAQYIKREMEGEIDLKNPIYLLIFNEYCSRFEKDHSFDGSFFVKHEDHTVSQATANLLADMHQLSRMWSKKGTHVRKEEDDLKKVIDQAIGGYKYDLVMDILQKIENRIKKIQKEEDADEKLKLLYEKYTLYTQYKMNISKTLGDRIVLRR